MAQCENDDILMVFMISNMINATDYIIGTYIL